MKAIKEIYQITYTKYQIEEDDVGNLIKKPVTDKIYEFNYDDCINTYVSICEDGNECSYEMIDSKISNTIRDLDLFLNYSVLKLINAKKANVGNSIEEIKNEIEIWKIAIITIFNNFDLQVFNEEKRFKEYLNYHKQNK